MSPFKAALFSRRSGPRSQWAGPGPELAYLGPQPAGSEHCTGTHGAPRGSRGRGQKGTGPCRDPNRGTIVPTLLCAPGRLRAFPKARELGVLHALAALEAQLYGPTKGLCRIDTNDLVGNDTAPTPAAAEHLGWRAGYCKNLSSGGGRWQSEGNACCGIPRLTEWTERAAGNHLPNPSYSRSELLPQGEAGRVKGCENEEVEEQRAV